MGQFSLQQLLALGCEFDIALGGQLLQRGQKLVVVVVQARAQHLMGLIYQVRQGLFLERCTDPTKRSTGFFIQHHLKP